MGEMSTTGQAKRVTSRSFLFSFAVHAPYRGSSTLEFLQGAGSQRTAVKTRRSVGKKRGGKKEIKAKYIGHCARGQKPALGYLVKTSMVH